MVTRILRSAVVAALGLFLAVQPALAACGETGVQLQILGSGGPGASAGRASAGYLVWVDGVGRILVDAGGGIKQRFHASGADLGDVGLLALSHFHPDHSAEVPALLWPGGAALRVAGPSGSRCVPGPRRLAGRAVRAARRLPRARRPPRAGCGHRGRRDRRAGRGLARRRPPGPRHRGAARRRAGGGVSGGRGGRQLGVQQRSERFGSRLRRVRARRGRAGGASRPRRGV